MRQGIVVFTTTIVLAALASPAGAVTKVADYGFEGNLVSSTPGSPELTTIGTTALSTDAVTNPPTGQTATEGVLDFDAASGLAMSSVPANSTDYMIALQVRLDDLGMSGFRRLIDWSGGLLDAGAYVVEAPVNYPAVVALNGAYSPSSYVANFPSPIVENQWFNLIFYRTNSGIVLYLNGTLAGYVGTDSGTALGIGGLRFFADDSEEPGDDSASGSVARIRVYDGTVTTASQIAQIAAGGEPTDPPPPAPPTSGPPATASVVASAKMVRKGKTLVLPGAFKAVCPDAIPRFDCTYVARLRAAITTKAKGKKKRKRVVQLGRTSASLANNTSGSFDLQLSTSGARALKKAKRLKATVAIEITRPVFPAASTTATLTLKHPATRKKKR